MAVQLIRAWLLGTALGALACAPDIDRARPRASRLLTPTAHAAPAPEPATASPAARRRRAQLVVLDPGHGGEDRGSPGLYGLWEGEVALDLARRVKGSLAGFLPSLRVRLTRDADVHIPLEERASMANALGADLFVSLHLNAASTVVERGGITTFVLDVENDRNVLRLAAHENGTRTTEVSAMQFLVGSLARKDQEKHSLELAEFVQRNTLASARRFLPKLRDRGVRSAMFYVLVGAQMPAILLEGSFLTQPDEARLLQESAYRSALAEGIARGLVNYLSRE
ncbi:MAG TPA: N-acetylmuramoyl-L-alanine amidase [Polyangiales bacterium]|nr:N-acetylmuramoyl-L-alanine amidase [Polyangiales bacterium]